MSTGWIGGGSSGSMTLNAIVAGMDKYLRISREKIHAWGNNARLEQRTGNVSSPGKTYGGLSSGLSDQDGNVYSYNEEVPHQIIPVEVDCELHKSKILSDSLCTMPLSGRLGDNWNANNADYYWHLEQYRNDEKIGKVSFKFAAAGEVSPPNLKIGTVNTYTTLPNTVTNHGLVWFQDKLDETKKTVSVPAHVTKDFKKIYYQQSKVYVRHDDSFDIDFSWGSCKAWLITNRFDLHGDGDLSWAALYTVLKSSSLGFNNVIGSRANFILTDNSVDHVTGDLPEGSTVTVRAALSFLNDPIDYMVEKTVVVTASGGVTIDLLYHYIDVTSSSGERIQRNHLDYQADLNRVWVLTSSTGNWVQVTGFNGSSFTVAKGINTEGVIHRPPSLSSGFTIRSHSLPVTATGVNPVTYHSSIDGSGPPLLGTEPNTDECVLYNEGTVYIQKHRLLDKKPSGYDIWLATSNSGNISPGGSYSAGVVEINLLGALSKLDMSTSPMVVTPTISTTDNTPPSFQQSEIVLNDDETLGEFPDKILLRKGDFLTLRTTVDVNADIRGYPSVSQASRADRKSVV